MSRSSSRRSPLAIAALAAAAAAGAAGANLAERRAVARWSASDDPFRAEPRTLVGEERWVDSADGSRLRVVHRNADAPRRGVPIILAHGFTATADQWAPVAARLVDRGFTVVAFDQRGHGHSTSATGRFRPTDLGDDLAAVIGATAPAGAVLVGHSMGGIGIQAMLAGHQALRENLRGVVLVATLARPVPVPLGRLMAKLGGTALARRLMDHRIHGRVLARGGVGENPSITVLDVIRDGWAMCPDATRAGVMQDLGTFDFSDALRTVHVPTTVIAGDRDLVTPFDENRRIAELLPNGHLETLPGVGHAAHWEACDLVADVAAAHAENTPDNTPRSGAGRTSAAHERR